MGRNDGHQWGHSMATTGEKRWPPAGNFVATTGEKPMAIDTGRLPRDSELDQPEFTSYQARGNCLPLAASVDPCRLGSARTWLMRRYLGVTRAAHSRPWLWMVT